MDIKRLDNSFTQEDNMILSKSRLITPHARNLQGFFALIQNQANMSNVAAAKQTLPSLPVPKLSQTIEKYLKSVEPFLNETELNHTKKLLSRFQSEDGEILQRQLVERAKSTDNWLAEWWLKTAYLGYRDPVVVYSSPGLVFPFEDFKDEAQRLEYGAKLILGALSYKDMIDSGKMPVEKMGKEPLDMNQYNKIFGTCRLPGLRIDNLEYNPQSKHIVVARNNNFFKLQVLDNCGKSINFKDLITNLECIMSESKEPGPAIGVLTTDNRNNWGKAYEDLILDPANLKSVREIQTSLFLVCFDNPMPGNEPKSRTSASRQLIHGGGSTGNAANRWYDKTVQFIIGEDGTVGLTYEHSPAEGQPIAIMTDYVVNYVKNFNAKDESSAGFDSGLQKLGFSVDDRVECAIKTASSNVDKLASNLDMDAFQFDCYGKEFVKSQKLSPDSFIQIAMQYAFYRIHKVPGAHYESAATRKYIHGRTETIRSCSKESIAFAKAMLDDSKSDAERVSALREAINAHKKYSLEAVHGFGVDRHFLGLKLIAQENGCAIPEIFKDASWTRSTHMRISTSQVATKCDGFMCYGPLVPDGYACCYNPRANDINFAVSAFADHPDTTALQFKEALQCSLVDMHHMLAKTQKSKL